MPNCIALLLHSCPVLFPGLLSAALSAQIPVSLELLAPGLQCTSYVFAYGTGGTIPIFTGTIQPFGPIPIPFFHPQSPPQSPLVLGVLGSWGSETTCAVAVTAGASLGEEVLDINLRVRGASLPSYYYTLYGGFNPRANLQGELLLRAHLVTPSAIFLEQSSICSTPAGGHCIGSVWSIDVMDDGVPEAFPQARARIDPAPNGTPIRINFNLFTDGDSAQSSLDVHLRIRIAPALAASVTPFGTSCPIAGTQPMLTAGTSLPQIGQTCTFLVTSLPTTSSHAVLGALSLEAGSLGGVPLPIDLTPIGMPGCEQYIDPILSMLYGTVATNGTATWPLDIPDAPWVLGLPFYVQCLVDAPGENPLGLVTTNALACVAGL